VRKKKFGRRPTEQCVEDFCFVPRGGGKKRKDRVGRRMPRGALRKKGLREQCVEDFFPVPRGGCDRKAERACV